MIDTPRSLLERLRLQPDEPSWRRLFDLYAPLIRQWLHQQQIPATDAEDLEQEIFAAVVREMPTFQHSEQRGAFRCWLRTISVHRVLGFWRQRQNGPPAVDVLDLQEKLNGLEDPGSDLNRLWAREHDIFIARRLLQLLEPEFTASTWQAFRRQVMDGLSAADAAGELGISINAVLIAKSRVLRRFREEIAGLTD